MSQQVIIGKRHNRQWLFVDDCDVDLLELRWHPVAPNKGHLIYAQAAVKRPNGEYTTVLLHRLIGERIAGHPLTRKELVDHENGNGLDNLRKNLRVCTYMQNLQNQRLSKSNTSGYKGVTWNKGANKWQSAIRANGVRKYLGVFIDPKEAHEAYCKAALELHGEFANFGETTPTLLPIPSYEDIQTFAIQRPRKKGVVITKIIQSGTWKPLSDEERRWIFDDIDTLVRLTT